MTKSTITREQLIKKAQEQIEFCRHTKITGEGRVHVNQCAALFEIALAAMDSEPVAWTDEEELRDVNVAGIGYLFGIDREANKFSDPRRQIMLYRHAQQPVVPDEKDKTVDADDHPLLWSFNEGWNACRAAMLAAATQSPGSEPATVPGKWIPVSEQMPEDRISVILWDAEIGEVTSGHYSHKTQTFYHCGDAIENEITHWMPPPCAPQEVKGE